MLPRIGCNWAWIVSNAFFEIDHCRTIYNVWVNLYFIWKFSPFLVAVLTCGSSNLTLRVFWSASSDLTSFGYDTPIIRRFVVFIKLCIKISQFPPLLASHTILAQLASVIGKYGTRVIQCIHCVSFGPSALATHILSLKVARYRLLKLLSAHFKQAY